jgi:hypothetical protein
MTQFPSAFPPFAPTLEKPFFEFWAKLDNHNFSPIFAHKESTKPFIVHLRVLRNSRIGQNSLHLSGSTSTHRSAERLRQRLSASWLSGG